MSDGGQRDLTWEGVGCPCQLGGAGTLGRVRAGAGFPLRPDRVPWAVVSTPEPPVKAQLPRLDSSQQKPAEPHTRAQTHGNCELRTGCSFRLIAW